MANILIVGKELPESENLIKSFELHGHKIFASSTDTVSFENDNIHAFSWNKASSISAKTLLIQAEAKLIQIDRILIIFDGVSYAKHFDSERIEDCTQAVENMVSSYLYFCQTLLNRISQKTSKISVGFYLRPAMTKADLLSSKAASQSPCSNNVAVAQAAFKALAENFGTVMYDLQHVSVFLCINESGNELFNNDRESGTWLDNYFDSLEKLKNRQNEKQSLTWIKAGGKLAGGFGLFK